MDDKEINAAEERARIAQGLSQLHVQPAPIGALRDAEDGFRDRATLADILTGGQKKPAERGDANTPPSDKIGK